jgi:hypothetical protein
VPPMTHDPDHLRFSEAVAWISAHEGSWKLEREGEAVVLVLEIPGWRCRVEGQQATDWGWMLIDAVRALSTHDVASRSIGSATPLSSPARIRPAGGNGGVVSRLLAAVRTTLRAGKPNVHSFAEAVSWCRANNGRWTFEVDGAGFALRLRAGDRETRVRDAGSADWSELLIEAVRRLSATSSSDAGSRATGR